MAASAGIYSYYHPPPQHQQAPARMVAAGYHHPGGSSSSAPPSVSGVGGPPTAMAMTAAAAYAASAPYRGKYRCGRCGQYKVKHQCLASVVLVPAATQTVSQPPYYLLSSSNQRPHASDRCLDRSSTQRAVCHGKESDS
jgi:hypothetical protein